MTAMETDPLQHAFDHLIAKAAIKDGDRVSALDVARDFRKLYSAASASMNLPNITLVAAASAILRARVVAALGPAAWDEHHAIADEVLAEIDRVAPTSPDGSGSYDVSEVRCLVAEVRRLRSDEWDLRRLRMQT